MVILTNYYVDIWQNYDAIDNLKYSQFNKYKTLSMYLKIKYVLTILFALYQNNLDDYDIVSNIYIFTVQGTTPSTESNVV